MVAARRGRRRPRPRRRPGLGRRDAGAITPAARGRRRGTTPGPVVATVTHGSLSQTATARADIAVDGGTSVALPGDGVVTASPLLGGDTVGSGTVVLETNGRPVIALQGQFRFYRDLGTGETGPDVEQLQQALRDLGFRIPNAEWGKVGSATLQAMERLYKARGYAVPRHEAPPSPAPAPATSGPDGTVPTPAPTPAPETRYVSAQELLVIGGLPSVVASVPGVGTELTGEQTLALGSGSLSASMTVPDSMTTILAPGMVVDLSSEDGQVVSTAIATDKEATAGESGEWNIPLGGGDALPPAWNGLNVLATIHISEATPDSLIVPSRALTRGAGDTLTVLVQDDAGGFTEVAVREISVAAGQSAVEPTEPGALAEGDRVRVDVATASTP